MPIPSPPTLGYSFTTFSSTNPTGQQPGDKLDTEFNRIYGTLNALIGAVNASLNADGSLRTDAVEAAEGGGSPPEDGINVWDIPSQNSATLSQAWAEHMDGPVPVEYLAYGGIDGTHWSAAFYADQAAIIAANLDDQVRALLAAFNFPIATPISLGGVIPTAGGGLLIDIAGHLTLDFDTVARVDDARILGAQQRSEKNQPNGYAGLNGAGLLLNSVMPFATPTVRGAVSPKTGLTVDGSGNLYIDFGIDAGKVMQANDSRVLGAEQAANKGQPSGYAPLDATGLIPASFIPAAASPGGTGGTGVLTTIPSLNFLANITTGSALPTGVDLTTFLDTLVGDYRGAFLCRRSFGWDSLHPGPDGYVLTSQGFGLTPSWVEAPTAVFPSIGNNTFIANTSGATAVPGEKTLSAFLDAALANTQGALMYRGPTSWAALSPGTAGQILRTGGAAANPSWVNAPSGGGGSGLTVPETTNFGHFVFWNATDGTALSDGGTPAALIDTLFGTVQGSIIYRDELAWDSISPGTAGQILQSNGSSANPSWEDPPTAGTPDLDDIGSTRGSILYRGASAWDALTPGTAGQILQSNGAAADPTWEDAPSGGGGSSINDFDTYAAIDGFKTGRFYSPTGVNKTHGVGSSADWLYAFPFFVPATCSLKTLSITCYGTNSGTARVRLGVYSNTNGGPDALIVETGEFTTTSSVTTMTSPTLNSGSGQTLTRGWYWVAGTHNGIGGMSSIGVDVSTFNVLEGVLTGASTAGGAIGQDGSAAWIYAYARSYAAMPSTWSSTARVQWDSFAVPILGF